MDDDGLCGARQSDERAALHCDRVGRHGGRHGEQWVATWARDGSDVRWCVNSDDLDAQRPRYTADPPAASAA